MAEGPSRRMIVSAGAVAGLATAAPAAAASPKSGTPVFTDEQIARTYERYASFGDKAAGGPGDSACGEWLEGELKALGYAVRRQGYEAPAFDAKVVELTTGAAKATVIPQAIVVTTAAGGLTGPLRVAGESPGAADSIALVAMPYSRWSTIRGPAERLVKAAIAEGAAGVVLITTGPTGEALALNAPADVPVFDRPVATMAPKDAGPFLAAARKGERGTLTLTGRVYRRPAYNVIGSLKRGGAHTLAISTPRSGWFNCVGERGPGLAVWLALAGWAVKALPKTDVVLLATSNHEYENDGGHHFMQHEAPPVAETALWVHLGANVAARDWHELGGSPLPSADPQRYLQASPKIFEATKAAFAGQPGLEQVYPASVATSAGELTHVLRAGYDPAIGIFGAHRFHHARKDDLACASPPLARKVAEAMARVIVGHLGA